jgi:hypothetical protein
MAYLRAIRQPRLRWIVTAALLASQPARCRARSAPPTPPAPRPLLPLRLTRHGWRSNAHAKPTVVLVHGAWADSGS